MQRLTAPPRAGFTDTRIRQILSGGSVLDIPYVGCELLDENLRLIADISADFLVAGSVEHNNNATIHGTCGVTLSRELSWGTQLVRPYMFVGDRVGEPARFNLGAYSLATPEQVFAESVPAFACQGTDRLYLLDRELPDSYEVPAGALYLDAIGQAFADAGVTGVLIDGSAGDKALPVARTWPLVSAPNAGAPADDEGGDTGTGPATWLRVVNDLLAAINYRAVWCDQDGNYRCGLYVPPSLRGSEWDFDDDPRTTIVAPGQTLTRDMWQTPNRWVCVQSNRSEEAGPPSVGDGVYIVENPDDGPTSINARGGYPGGVWPRRYEFDVADHATLVARGDRQVHADRTVAATWKIKTSPLPIAGHADIATLTVAGRSPLVAASEWSLPLDGSDMSWTLDEVVGGA